jgi:hypothetical protein
MLTFLRLARSVASLPYHHAHERVEKDFSACGVAAPANRLTA